MIVELSPLWFPVTAQVVLIFLCWRSLQTSSGYFAGAIEALSMVFGTLFIWLVYFATMYFIVK